MTRGRAGTLMVVIAVLVTGCASGTEGGATSDGTSNASIGDAVDLAPSQIAASTVARPETPPPCEPADLVTWTAQVAVSDTSADAVLRIRNDGPAWCEVDISESPFRNPRVEPDVWLRPGEWADLVVGGAGGACGSGTVVTLAAVVLNGEERVVPTAAVQPCGWQLTAFFVNESPVEPCAGDTLDVAMTASGLVVRNSSFTACVLGDLVGVTGRATVAGDDDGVAIDALGGGDVVAFGLGESVTACDDGPVVLEFDAAGAIEVTAVAPSEGCRPIRIGPARPWYDGPAGPLREVRDPVVALELLDPFAGPTMSR